MGEKIEESSPPSADTAALETGSAAEVQGSGFGESNQSHAQATPKGHGPNGADAYRGAKRVAVRHPSLAAGDACLACRHGTTYDAAAGCPLDNNLCERALKKAILHRKNALFYKSQNGASVGDLFMSLIHTCQLNEANPFDYRPSFSSTPTRWRLRRTPDALELRRGAGLIKSERGLTKRQASCQGHIDRDQAMHRPKRKPKGLAAIPKQPGAVVDLRQELTRHKKSELIDFLFELAQADRGVLRQLMARFDVAVPPEELVIQTRQAISDATAFDSATSTATLIMTPKLTPR